MRLIKPRQGDGWGNGGIAPCILNLRNMYCWTVSFTLRHLHPWESARHVR